jgi:hypothetical protein
MWIRTTHDIEEAINSFNNLIQQAGWASTPEPPKIPQSPTCPLLIKQKNLIKEDSANYGLATCFGRTTIIKLKIYYYLGLLN